MRIIRKKVYKEKKKGFLVRMVKSMIKDWDIKVMSYVMVIVCAVSLISGTVAWFTNFPSIRAKNMGIKLADCDSLRVSVIEGGTDVDEIQVLEGETIAISLNLPNFVTGETYEREEYVFTNQETVNPVSPEIPLIETIATKEEKTVAKLEPGSYGEMKFYVTSLDREINYCRVTPYILLTYSDGSEEQMNYETWQIERINIPENESRLSDEKIAELRALAKGHFLMFQERKEIFSETEEEDTLSSQFEYEKQIHTNLEGTREGILEVPLTFDIDKNSGEEKEVIVYWCWPYEYKDIPKEIKENISWTGEGKAGLLPECFFQEQKNNDGTEIEFTEISDDEEVLTTCYDEADVNIGSYVKGIRFLLRIDGFYSNDDTVTPDVPTDNEMEVLTEGETEMSAENENLP